MGGDDSGRTTPAASALLARSGVVGVTAGYLPLVCTLNAARLAGRRVP